MDAIQLVKEAEKKAEEMIEAAMVNSRRKLDEARSSISDETSEIIRQGKDKADEIVKAGVEEGEKLAEPIVARGKEEAEKLGQVSSSDLEQAVRKIIEKVVS